MKKSLEKEDIAKSKDDEIHRKIFLGGLSKATTEASLETHFSKLGQIEDILINRNIEDGSSKGCAFLLFKEHQVAQKLLKMNQLHLIDGCYVEVKQCYEKSKSRAIQHDRQIGKVLESINLMPQFQSSSFVGTLM